MSCVNGIHSNRREAKETKCDRGARRRRNKYDRPPPFHCSIDGCLLCKRRETRQIHTHTRNSVMATSQSLWPITLFFLLFLYFFFSSRSLSSLLLLTHWINSAVHLLTLAPSFTQTDRQDPRCSALLLWLQSKRAKNRRWIRTAGSIYTHCVSSFLGARSLSLSPSSTATRWIEGCNCWEGTSMID